MKPDKPNFHQFSTHSPVYSASQYTEADSTTCDVYAKQHSKHTPGTREHREAEEEELIKKPGLEDLQTSQFIAKQWWMRGAMGEDGRGIGVSENWRAMQWGWMNTDSVIYGQGLLSSLEAEFISQNCPSQLARLSTDWRAWVCSALCAASPYAAVVHPGTLG